MTDPFPLTPWPAPGTLITQGLLEEKINNPLRDLDQRISRPGFGTGSLKSTSPQNIVTNEWRSLGWASPSSTLTGSGISASSFGFLLVNPGQYDVDGFALLTGSAAGNRRFIAIDLLTAEEPAVSTDCIICVPPPGANTVFLKVAGTIVTTEPNEVVTVWIYQDSGGDLSVSRRSLNIRRAA